MQKDNPVYKGDILTTLKETLLNALSTIYRLQCDNNPVMDRNQEIKTIDSWCVLCTEENQESINKFRKNSSEESAGIGCYHGIDRCGEITGLNMGFNFKEKFDHLISTEEFYNKICYTKPTENILQKGKEVLNSQNEEKFNWIIFTEEGFGFPAWQLKDWRGDKGSNWDETVKVFIARTDAMDFLLMNKPLLSLKDYDNVIVMALNKAGRVKYDEETRNQLKIIAESKLNNK